MVFAVLPGETPKIINEYSETGEIILGPGFARSTGGRPKATKPGLLRRDSTKNMFWIDTRCRRYVPTTGDSVIGVVAQKMTESYKVDIGGADLATLSYLAFEGATKRNRPNVNIGDAVYCRVLIAIKDMEPELVCIDAEGKSKGYGVLPPDGFLFQSPLHVVRNLLSQDCRLLKLLGKEVSFEVAIGVNGKVHVKGRKTKDVIAVSNCILESEFIAPGEEQELVNRTIKELKGF